MLFYQRWCNAVESRQLLIAREVVGGYITKSVVHHQCSGRVSYATAKWLFWLTRCGPQPLHHISASSYRPMHHLGLCALPLLCCWSFLAYTPNWLVALFCCCSINLELSTCWHLTVRKPSHFQTPLENPSVQTHLVLLGCITRLCIFGPKGKSIIIVIIMNALWLMSIILVTKVHMNNLLPESIHDSELAAFTTSHATCHVSSKLCFKKTQFRTGDFRTLLSLLLTFRTGTISVTIRFNGCRSSLLVW